MPDVPEPPTRPLETGWLSDTPVGDTLLRRFAHNQSDLNAAFAVAAGGRADRREGISLADSSGPVPYFNQAVLLRPLTGAGDPLLDDAERFFAGSGPATLLSLWPTPDLRARDWTLIGHPSFVARAPGPHQGPPRGVEVRVVADPADLATVERVAVEGYPLPEAGGLTPGTILRPALLQSAIRYRLAFVDGEPAAAAASHVAHGVINLCFAAAVPSARRRGAWSALVRARIDDRPDLPAVAFTSDDSRPGFERMGFLVVTRFTLWSRGGTS